MRRQWFTTLSTIGRLAIGGRPQCYSLEPAVRSDDVKPRAIPEAIYPLTLRWSMKFNRHTPHIENVPGFEEIEIHIGNSFRDTDACTLVGQVRGPQPDFIGKSVVAFSHLMSALFSDAVLRNPGAATEQELIWDVGTIAYSSLQGGGFNAGQS